MRIAILGGTGPEGLGLAARFAAAGMQVILGSRSAERAATAAASLHGKVPAERVTGAGNLEAATAADIVFVGVPYDGLDPMIAECGGAMAGKIVVDVIVPLKIEKGFFRTETIPEGSAAERLQAKIPTARVVSGFKHESAQHLQDLSHDMEGDVLLAGNDVAAKEEISKLVRLIKNLRPVDAGDLRICAALESVTALLLNLNKKHKARASVKIVGL